MPLKAAMFFGCLMVFTYAGYPLIAFLFSRVFRRPVARRTITPAISIILPVHNEGARLAAKIANLLGQGYPSESLEIIVVDDGSSDGAAGRLEREGIAGVKVVSLPERQGKASALNAGMSAANGDIIVFTDVRQELAPGALAALVANFADGGVAAVTGRLAAAGGGAEGLFRRYEELLRRWESAWGSCAGATGALYAVRREFARPIPPETILDDLVISLGAARHGRLVYEKGAMAIEAFEEASRIRARRLRTLAGNWQMLFHAGRFRTAYSRRTAAQVICHKGLRLLFPFLAAGCAVSAAAAGPAFAWTVIAAVAAAIAWLPGGGQLCELLKFLLASPVHALGRYMLGRETVLWAR